jgi:hypothetical protein
LSGVISRRGRKSDQPRSNSEQIRLLPVGYSLRMLCPDFDRPDALRAAQEWQQNPAFWDESDIAAGDSTPAPPKSPEKTRQ